MSAKILPTDKIPEVSIQHYSDKDNYGGKDRVDAENAKIVEDLPEKPDRDQETSENANQNQVHDTYEIWKKRQQNRRKASGELSNFGLFLSHCRRQTPRSDTNERKRSLVDFLGSEEAGSFVYWADWLDLDRDVNDDWWNVITTAIDEANTIVCFVTEQYLGSVSCLQEVAYAKYVGRFLVVVMLEDEARFILDDLNRVETMWEKCNFGANEGSPWVGDEKFTKQSVENVYNALKKPNWIFSNKVMWEESSQTVQENLLLFVTADVAHRKMHSKIHLKARAWEKEGAPEVSGNVIPKVHRRKRFDVLLSKQDTDDASDWRQNTLVYNSQNREREKEPAIAELHHRFIRASENYHKYLEVQKRKTLARVVMSFLVLTAGLVVAIVVANNATIVANKRLAQSQREVVIGRMESLRKSPETVYESLVTAQKVQEFLWEEDLDLNAEANIEVELLNTLLETRLQGMVYGYYEHPPILAQTFSPDGRHLVTLRGDNKMSFYDLDSSSQGPVQTLEINHQGARNAISKVFSNITGMHWRWHDYLVDDDDHPNADYCEMLWSGNGQSLVVKVFHFILVWKTTANEHQLELSSSPEVLEHSTFVQDMKISPDSEYLGFTDGFQHMSVNEYSEGISGVFVYKLSNPTVFAELYVFSSSFKVDPETFSHKVQHIPYFSFYPHPLKQGHMALLHESVQPVEFGTLRYILRIHIIDLENPTERPLKLFHSDWNKWRGEGMWRVQGQIRVYNNYVFQAEPGRYIFRWVLTDDHSTLLGKQMVYDRAAPVRSIDMLYSTLAIAFDGGGLVTTSIPDPQWLWVPRSWFLTQEYCSTVEFLSQTSSSPILCRANSHISLYGRNIPDTYITSYPESGARISISSRNHIALFTRHREYGHPGDVATLNTMAANDYGSYLFDYGSQSRYSYPGLVRPNDRSHTMAMTRSIVAGPHGMKVLYLEQFACQAPLELLLIKESYGVSKHIDLMESLRATLQNGQYTQNQTTFMNAIDLTFENIHWQGSSLFAFATRCRDRSGYAVKWIFHDNNRVPTFRTAVKFQTIDSGCTPSPTKIHNRWLLACGDRRIWDISDLDNLHLFHSGQGVEVWQNETGEEDEGLISTSRPSWFGNEESGYYLGVAFILAKMRGNPNHYFGSDNIVSASFYCGFWRIGVDTVSATSLVDISTASQFFRDDYLDGDLMIAISGIDKTGSRGLAFATRNDPHLILYRLTIESSGEIKLSNAIAIRGNGDISVLTWSKHGSFLFVHAGSVYFFNKFEESSSKECKGFQIDTFRPFSMPFGVPLAMFPIEDGIGFLLGGERILTYSLDFKTQHVRNILQYRVGERGDGPPIANLAEKDC